MQKVNILGVNFSYITKNGVEQYVLGCLYGAGKKLIVTPNAEFVLAAQHDEEFFHILNRADLAVLDGSGPQIAARMLGTKLKRYPGADLIRYILKVANEQKIKVLIVNWQDGLSTEHDLKLMMSANYPAVICEVINVSRTKPNIDLKRVNEFGPHIILANLGAPYQEKFLYHIRKQVPTLSLAIGIGGALDFLTGKVRRAPKIFRQLGIEWFWRLIQKPANSGSAMVYKRYRRIWNAVFVFMYKFIKWQYFLPYLYRPNVACWLYKKDKNGYSVLMVERVDMPGAWQLPQGGTDGEGIERAGRRELFEELGVSQLETRAIYKDVFRYKFRKQKRAEVQRHLGYKGQKQSLYIAEFLGKDEHFSVNFWDHTAWRWVATDRLLAETYEVRREGYQKFLDLFNNFIKHET